MSFLPTTYKKIPSNSNFMKLVDGENVFRILSSAIVGYEYWNTENKPIRSKEMFVGFPPDIKVDDDGRIKISHFWAFVVWNYDEERVQILEITQKKVQQAIKSLVDSKRWGDPKRYDIIINRSGTGYDTTYQVSGAPDNMGNPSKKILDAYAKMTIDLEQLYTGGDPFIKGVVSKEEAAVEMATVPGTVNPDDIGF